MLKKFSVADIFVPNISAAQLIEVFFISAVSSVIVIRVFLKITDYPQIGGGGLHIAHMLWGGLLMFAALFLMFIFINRNVRAASALIGGIGFGMFIDELGKFITSDNNYFYQPTIALIYIIFVLIFLLYKFVSSYTKYSEKTYAVNAAEGLTEIISDNLDFEKRAKALDYLKNCHQEDPVVFALRRLFTSAIFKEKPDSLNQKLKRYLANIHQRIIKSARISRLLIFFMVLSLGVHVMLSAILFFKTVSFEQVGNIISSLISGLLVFLGVYYFLKGKQQTSYKIFLYAVLIQIFLTQFFLFWANQLLAVGSLVFNLFLYQIIKYKLERLPVKGKLNFS